MKKINQNTMGNKWIQRLLVAACFTPSAMMAQKAGDLISGRVYDDEGPLMMVNIVERDAANRIVAHGITDINGNFSFRIVDPKNKLQITYVGYKNRELPIKGMVYNVKMESSMVLGPVTITATKKASTGGLAIPTREMSIAAQEIDAKEFEGLAVTTVDEALQGRIAGLDIVANSGNLGAGTSMRLRGVSSINGNSEPLIVVDGNIWESDATSNFDFNNPNEDRFAELLNVNPEDIAKISVLKDAAATAIYGSQGANGVIRIETKRGARGKTKVNFSYRFNGTYQPTGIQMINGDEYTMLMKEAYFNPRLSDASSNIREFNYDPEFSEYQMYNNNTDWRKAVRQFGQEHKYYVSLSGGGEKANFRISGGYDKQTGSVIAQELDRFSTRVALDYFVSNRIKIVTNFALTYTNNQRNYYTGLNSSKGLLEIGYQKMPNLSIYEQDRYGNSTGDYYHMLSSASSQFDGNQKGLENPIALAHLAKNDLRSYNIVPEFQLHYNLLGMNDDETQLKYEGAVVFNVFNSFTDRFYPTELQTSGWNSSQANRASSDSHKSLGVTTTHTLTFSPKFKNTDHSFMSLLRGQLNSGTSNSQSTTIYGIPSGTITSPTVDGYIDGFSTSAGQWRSIYFTFQAHYAYRSKYAATFSVRRDGSTKFGKDQRWGNFPALSFRWNIVDEKWMKKTENWLSMLSIRPGWGKVGNQPGPEGLFYSKYVSGNTYGGNTTISPSNIRLSNLKWENKETWNVGFDFGFLENLFTADLNLYRQKTTDLLMYNRALPTSSGYTALAVQNCGTMMNDGWEFNINGNRLVNKGKFSVDVNITFANNRNEITEMDPTVLASLNSDFDRGNGSYLTRVQLNNAFGSMYGFRYKGVYQYSDYSTTEVKGVSGPNSPVVRNASGEVVLDENGRTKPMLFCYGTTAEYEFKGGDAMYEDINHDGNINELDIVYLGSSLPKITGGFGFKLNYGRFTWNNQFNFRQGNKVINQSRMLAESMYNNNNQSAAVNWRWRTEGDVTTIPRALYQYGYNWLGSDRFVEDGSFIRLNYTQLSYSIDPKILKDTGLSQVSLYLSANNLFCLTKYSGADPEVGYGGYGVTTDTGQTPRARSFTAGVTIGF